MGVLDGASVTSRVYGTPNSFLAPLRFDVLRAEIDSALSPIGGDVGMEGGVAVFATAVPEPTTGALLDGGFVAVVGAARPRRRTS